MATDGAAALCRVEASVADLRLEADQQHSAVSQLYPLVADQVKTRADLIEERMFLLGLVARQHPRNRPVDRAGRGLMPPTCRSSIQGYLGQELGQQVLLEELYGVIGTLPFREPIPDLAPEDSAQLLAYAKQLLPRAFPQRVDFAADTPARPLACEAVLTDSSEAYDFLRLGLPVAMYTL